MLASRHVSHSKWNEQHRELEDRGQWRLLLERYQSLRDIYSEEDFDLRWQAALARAFSFLGQVKEAERLFEKLSVLPLEHESQCVLWLAFSMISRRRKDWALALRSARRALELAERLQDAQLTADSKFAIACCTSELGEKFRALDLFQEIRNDKGRVSRERRVVAAVNEAWILWDLGMVHPFREVISTVPEGLKERLELCHAIVNDDQDMILRRLRYGLDQKVVNVAEKIYIVELLVIWLAVGEDGAFADHPWIRSFLESLNADDRSHNVEALLKIIDGEVFDVTGIEFSGWRERLELSFFSCLSWARVDREKAKEIYRIQVDAYLAEHGLRNPLFPRWQSIEEQETVWSTRIASVLGLLNKVKVSARLQIRGTELTALNGAHAAPYTVDLGNRLASLNLLKALSRAGGEVISKEDLHKALDNTEYDPLVHDSRLYKTLKRTGKLIQDKFALTPWRMPGDGRIHIQLPIEVDEK